MGLPNSKQTSLDAKNNLLALSELPSSNDGENNGTCRPEYKSLRQLILETKFTERYCRFSRFEYSDDVENRPRPKGPDLDTFYDPDPSFYQFAKDTVLSTDDTDSPGQGFDNRHLSKMRRHIYRYVCVPIWVVNTAADISKNGPCSSLKETAQIYSTTNFRDHSNDYQLASNFFAWRCAMYMVQAPHYQQRQFVRNRNEFLAEVQKWKATNVLATLTEVLNCKDVANLVYSYVSLNRRMRTCRPVCRFEWRADGDWFSETCSQRCSYDDYLKTLSDE